MYICGKLTALIIKEKASHHYRIKCGYKLEQSGGHLNFVTIAYNFLFLLLVQISTFAVVIHELCKPGERMIYGLATQLELVITARIFYASRHEHSACSATNAVQSK